jgi:hypothetical protein
MEHPVVAQHQHQKKTPPHQVAGDTRHWFGCHLQPHTLQTEAMATVMSAQQALLKGVATCVEGGQGGSCVVCALLFSKTECEPPLAK